MERDSLRDMLVPLAAVFSQPSIGQLRLFAGGMDFGRDAGHDLDGVGGAWRVAQTLRVVLPVLQ